MEALHVETVTDTRFAEMQAHLGGRRQFVRPVEAACAWCPGFVPVRGESHGICAACAAKLEAEDRS